MYVPSSYFYGTRGRFAEPLHRTDLFIVPVMVHGCAHGVAITIDHHTKFNCFAITPKLDLVAFTILLPCTKVFKANRSILLFTMFITLNLGWDSDVVDVVDGNNVCQMTQEKGCEAG